MDTLVPQSEGAHPTHTSSSNFRGPSTRQSLSIQRPSSMRSATRSQMHRSAPFMTKKPPTLTKNHKSLTLKPQINKRRSHRQENENQKKDQKSKTKKMIIFLVSSRIIIITIIQIGIDLTTTQIGIDLTTTKIRTTHTIPSTGIITTAIDRFSDLIITTT